MAEIRIKDLYDFDPKLALEYILLRVEKNHGWGPRIWQCQDSNLSDGIRSGSYQIPNRKDLNGRKYEIEYFDGTIGLYFTDAYWDYNIHKLIFKETGA